MALTYTLASNFESFKKYFQEYQDSESKHAFKL